MQCSQRLLHSICLIVQKLKWKVVIISECLTVPNNIETRSCYSDLVNKSNIAIFELPTNKIQYVK